MLTAFITLIIASLGLILNLVVCKDPENILDIWFNNLITLIASKVLHLPPKSASRKRGPDFWKYAIQSYILGLSDTQLVTGVAILLTGFLRVASSLGDIRVYHLSVVFDLAWFASNTHLAALGILEKEFHKTNFYLRMARAILMLFMCLSLVFASIVTGSWNWYNNFNCPALCIIPKCRSVVSGSIERWMVVSLIFVISGYMWMFFTMFELTYNFMWEASGWIHTSYMNLESTSTNPKGHGRVTYMLLKVVFGPVWCFNYFLSANIGDLIMNWFWFGIGLWSLVTDVRQGRTMLGENNNEGQMGFGQFVQLLLIFLPIFSGFEIYFGMKFLLLKV